MGILVSLLLHVVLAILVHLKEPLKKIENTSIEVSFIPELIQKPKEQAVSQQIVNMPDKIVEPIAPLESAAFQSDRDSQVEKQQIKRGDAPDAGQVGQKPVAMAKKEQPAVKPPEPQKQQEKASSEPEAQPKPVPHELKDLDLRLDNKTLLAKFSDKKSKKTSRDQNSLLQNNSDDTVSGEYNAFSRPVGSGAAILGLRGSNDFIPSLPDGDLTLLNTKANLFAVFVRRVATQVFSQLRRSGWESLRASDINQIDTMNTVRAVLDPAGNLIKVTIEGGSGSQKFDQVLIDAVKQGARDPNPPKAAKADDGNFHFIFKARSWSRLDHNARTGAPFERRWLLLSTGLD